LFVAVVEKLVPSRVMLTPASPVTGEKLVSVRESPTGGLTVKSCGEVAISLSTCTVIFPVVAPVGTLTVKLEDVAAVTAAAVPLNFTALLAGVVEKLVPVRVTVVPSVPELGENPVRVGMRISGLDGSSFSLHELHNKKKKKLSINTWDTFFMSKKLVKN
jgi:hypothetical protein